jgi:hypothetical protein
LTISVVFIWLSELHRRTAMQYVDLLRSVRASARAS